MEFQEDNFQKVLHDWQQTVIGPWHRELSEKLTEVELSALYSCIPDCLESFHKIYYELLPALVRMPSGDHDKLFDCLYEIGGISGSLEHIRSHIMDARKGFDVLLKLLEDNAVPKQ